MNKPLVAVDFDNTITDDNVRYWEGERPEPNHHVRQLVRDIYHNHGHVLIWTARPWAEANRIAAHLAEWEIPYHGIRCEKGSADAYIDDKAVQPNDAYTNDVIQAIVEDSE
jgi:hydroxymethylpyrimidine pyrophosphatase-like HAD family hydrolase